MGRRRTGKRRQAAVRSTLGLLIPPGIYTLAVLVNRCTAVGVFLTVLLVCAPLQCCSIEKAAAATTQHIYKAEVPEIRKWSSAVVNALSLIHI